MSGDDLVTALAGDATTLGTSYIASQAVTNTVRANPNSASTLILVAGGIAALFVVLVMLKK